MEEILASIRKIIADDQILPLTRPATGIGTSRAPQGAVEQVAMDAQELHDEQYDEGEASEPPAQAKAEAPRTSPSLHTMSDFEAAFAELRPSFSAPPSIEKVEEIQVQAPPEPAPVQPTPAPAAARAEPARPAAPDETALVSPSTGASVSSAFNALATTMFLQNTGMVEEAIRDMMRPMLKQWLDDNLPTMVERLVRAEIERVARGGR
jgi:cell pole-organizing protein PopZ